MLNQIRPKDLGFIALIITLGLLLDCCANVIIAWNPGSSSYSNQEAPIENDKENRDSRDRGAENLMDRSVYKEISFCPAGFSLLRRLRILSGFSSVPGWGTKDIPIHSRVFDFTHSDYEEPAEHAKNTEEGFISMELDWILGKSEAVYLNRDRHSTGSFSRTAEKSDIRRKLRRVASELGLDPRLAVALGEVESSFNPEAVSPKGAVGVLQLVPRFFFKEPETDGWVLYDPDRNIRMGLRYMKSLLERFEYDIELSLAAYNAGPRRVVEAGYAIPSIEETQKYVRRVREAMEKVSLDSLEGRYALSGKSSQDYHQEGRLEGNASYLD